MRTPSPEDRLHAELQDHIERQVTAYVAGGMPEADARRRVRLELGGLDQAKEECRDVRRFRWLSDLSQDVRFAMRMWRRAPTFTVVVILVLAVGIGANTTIFTVVNALLLRPLSGRAGELIGLFSHARATPDSYRGFSYPNYMDLRDRSDIFEGVIAHTFTPVGVPAGDQTRRVFAEVVSDNYFATLGVTLAAGRTFTPDESRPGAGIPVAIVGYDRWREERFDPALIGRTINVNAQSVTVIGIAPSGFTGTIALLAPELWLPFGMFDTMVTDPLKNKSHLADRTNTGLAVAGVLRPGVTLEAANERLERLSRQLEEAYPENRDQVVSVHPLSRLSISTSPSSDAALMAISALLLPLSGTVLLIGCLNVANMFLARGAARRREMAIRLALGGGTRRILRQLLTESFLIALAGAVLGLAFGAWATRLLAVSLASILPLSVQLGSIPDANVLLAAIGCAVLSTLVFGLAPALKLSRIAATNVGSDIKALGGDGRGTKRVAPHAWLIAGQLAASLTLIAIGGSVAAGATRAAAADPGFRYDGLLLVTVDASMAQYDDVRGQTTLRAVLDRLRQIPGVESVATASLVPFGDSNETRTVVRASPNGDPGRRSPTYTLVSSDYFKTLRLPVLRGREFTPAEESSSEARRVVIIDERLATRLFGNEDPIGEAIYRGRLEGDALRPSGDPLRVMGVVPSVRDEVFERVPTTHVYVPWGAEYRGTMHFHVRTAPGREAAVAELVRQEIRELDPQLPILEATPMRRLHERGLLLWLIRAAGSLLAAFAGIALLLAAIGVYGVKAHLVSERTREIGIRLALGARKRDILWMLIRDGAPTMVLGLAVGMLLAGAIAVATSQLTAGRLTLDPFAFVVAPLVLLMTTLAATYLPARRATRGDALDALKTE